MRSYKSMSADASPNIEGLGIFYLGRNYDQAQAKSIDHPLLYDAKDLVTHAVCVGMTGSGKTGLCIAPPRELTANRRT